MEVAARLVDRHQVHTGLLERDFTRELFQVRVGCLELHHCTSVVHLDAFNLVGLLLCEQKRQLLHFERHFKADDSFVGAELQLELAHIKELVQVVFLLLLGAREITVPALLLLGFLLLFFLSLDCGDDNLGDPLLDSCPRHAAHNVPELGLLLFAPHLSDEFDAFFLYRLKVLRQQRLEEILELNQLRGSNIEGGQCIVFDSDRPADGLNCKAPLLLGRHVGLAQESVLFHLLLRVSLQLVVLGELGEHEDRLQLGVRELQTERI